MLTDNKSTGRVKALNILFRLQQQYQRRICTRSHQLRLNQPLVLNLLENLQNKAPLGLFQTLNRLRQLFEFLPGSKTKFLMSRSCISLSILYRNIQYRKFQGEYSFKCFLLKNCRRNRSRWRTIQYRDCNLVAQAVKPLAMLIVQKLARINIESK